MTASSLSFFRFVALVGGIALACGSAVAQAPQQQTVIIPVAPSSPSAASSPMQLPPQAPLAPFPGPPPVIMAPAGPPDASVSASPPSTAVPGYRPGLLDAMGQLMGQGVANWNAGFDAAFGAFGGLGVSAGKGALDAAKGMGDAAKGASDATARGVGASMGGASEMASSIGRLSAARVIPGRERCTVAPNGGPDCAQAAEALCKVKGYSTGRSVDFETSEKCPTPTVISGRRASAEACVQEHFVIRAFCQ